MLKKRNLDALETGQRLLAELLGAGRSHEASLDCFWQEARPTATRPQSAAPLDLSDQFVVGPGLTALCSQAPEFFGRSSSGPARRPGCMSKGRVSFNLKVIMECVTPQRKRTASSPFWCVRLSRRCPIPISRAAPLFADDPGAYLRSRRVGT